MYVSDILVFKTMDVQCFLFKCLLFQTLVAWCGAKHVTINLNSLTADMEGADEVQESIRNLMHTGEYLFYIFLSSLISNVKNLIWYYFWTNRRFYGP